MNTDIPLGPPQVVVTRNDIVICRKCKTSDFRFLSTFALFSTQVIGQPKQMVKVRDTLECNHCGERLDTTQQPLTFGELKGNKQGLKLVEKEPMYEPIPLEGDTGEGSLAERPAGAGKDEDAPRSAFRGRVDLPEEPGATSGGLDKPGS